MRRPILLALALAGVAVAAALAPSREIVGANESSIGAPLRLAVESDEQRFPHAKHARLFPSCDDCHGGVSEDDAGRVPLTGPGGVARYPEPQSCVACHDGQREARVDWDGPRRAPSNLDFSHAEHRAAADTGRVELSCRDCHAKQGGVEFMNVGRAQPEPCVACHGHAAPAHLAEASPCRTCHLPLARAVALSPERIAGFPEPPSHTRADFVAAHAPTVDESQQRCATCHTRNSCERCHANGAQLKQVALLAPDARVARLVANKAPEYPVPATHRRADFTYAHGAQAKAEAGSCANCHTRPSCTTCHIGRLGADAIAQLPAGDATRGVRLQAHAPLASDSTTQARAHPPNFAAAHGPAAGANRASCEGCHEQRKFCTDCHDGQGRREFHPPNFATRHPSEAYSRQRDCSSCHNREAFCGACHQRLGLKSGGRTGEVAYHTAQPLWLIQHARAARQGLESCTTCHVQRDCMQCHSQTGWGVSPHGRDFDARRMSARNAETCRYCHLGDPLKRR